MTGAAPDGIRKLPVWRTLGESLRLVVVHWRLAIKRGALPFGLWIAGLYVLGYLASQHWDDGLNVWLAGAVQAAGAAAVLPLLLVPWFRAVAGTVPDASNAGLLVYLRHGGWLLLIWLGMSGSLWVLEASLGSVGLNDTSGPWNVLVAPLKSLLPLYVLARLGLILPIIAVEGQGSIVTAWTRSRGNGWRMTAIFLVPIWVIALLGGLLAQELIPDEHGALIELFGTLYSSFFVFLDCLIISTALALLYRSTGEPS